MMRGIGSVLAGFMVWSIMWLACGTLLPSIIPDKFDANGITAHSGMLIVFLVWSVVCSFVSGYISMMVAQAKPLMIGLILGIALLIVGIGVQSSCWDAMPLWYHIPFLVLLVPVAIFGCFLRSTSSP